MKALELTQPEAGIEEIVHSEAYPPARRRVFRQLLEALLYEQMIAYDSRIAADGAEEITITGTDAEGRPVYYRCAFRRKLSFGKLRLTNQLLYRQAAEHQDGLGQEAEDIALFLQEIVSAMVEEPRYLERFTQEIEQTLVKEAAARSHRLLHPVSGSRELADLEGDVIEAHPYHPCFKSRIGFQLEDNARYGPEFHGRFQLVWLAVHKEDLIFAVSKDRSWTKHIADELGEETVARFVQKLERQGLAAAEFTFVPVHPWQWREKIAPLYFRFMASGRMVVLGEEGDHYSPQQSIRSLSNRNNRLKNNVKTAISIVNTSAVRLLGTHHVTNAPILSDWLESIVASDRYLHDELKLVLLKEHAGVSFRYNLLPGPVRAAGYGTLGAIWRESVYVHLEEGEEAAPFTVLCHIGADGKPFIDSWVQREGLRSWLDKLLAASMLPLIHLLFEHGIAMESHGQNLVLIHKQGVPSRIALRDLPGGVRFHTRDGEEESRPEHLLDSDPLHPNSYSTSPMETNNVQKIRNFLMDSFLQIMLADLCLVLEEHYGLEETEFWQAAAAPIHSYLSAFGLHKAERYDLFAETIEVGQLTRRRLFGEHVIRNHSVVNPLYQMRETGV
ncbi:IucA/IucC family protein [Paenibacillus sp. Leaf72]|uniref:IucA/IucC family protein n=1 Tax=Paenibacillus sp. Leaf72 TaxID=1736234 RepID=UPI0006F23A46|nr:IucA/IucC family protein [Paenibacillus sp. Leaf72]KQN98997.1 hypothetical protein ASF12_19645 [Paenibacillus sp. Leaf72]